MAIGTSVRGFELHNRAWQAFDEITRFARAHGMSQCARRLILSAPMAPGPRSVAMKMGLDMFISILIY
eukprot:113344-Amorphochlora_amoeboformis.AAC.1